jgi:cyclic 2,3-diphosphoglycerate synthase
VTRALALVDGEHYAAVVREALETLPYDFVAAHMLGGTEKLRGGDDYGVPLLDDLERALADHAPEVVVDLSDEPVLGPPDRFALASRVLAHGLPYVGADFRLEPPPLEEFALPSIGIVGVGKRVGKTAVTSYVARLLSREHDLVVVSMGRGGPRAPEPASPNVTVEDLLELSRAGHHAASDYLEVAAVARVPTIGCRRCGGGLAGATFVSNVGEGAALAAQYDPDLVVFDGSGAALPPIATDRRILVAGAHQPASLVAGYLNAFRILVSDLVVLTMADDAQRRDEVRRAIHDVQPAARVIAAVLRPHPQEPVEGRRIAFFTTAPDDAHERQAAHLRDACGADVAFVSGNLSRRAQLEEDVRRARGVDAFVTELKGAAIDIVAEAGARDGVEVILADNDLVPGAGEPDLDEELLLLAGAATEARARA